MSFVVECILNAEPYRTKENEVYWVYTVKWFQNHGLICTTRETERHPIFKKDPSILKRFWDSCGFDPDTYNLTTVIRAKEEYIKECENLQYISEKKRECPEPSTSRRLRRRSVSNDNEAHSSIEPDSPTVIVISDDDEEVVNPAEHANDRDLLLSDKRHISLTPLGLPNGDAMNVDTNRDMSISLPPIAILDDLPDFEDLYDVRDIVEIINENAMPSTSEPLEIDRHSDISMSESESEVTPQPPNHISRLTTDTEDGLYVDHDYILDPSTLAPLSSLFKSPGPVQWIRPPESRSQARVDSPHPTSSKPPSPPPDSRSPSSSAQMQPSSQQTLLPPAEILPNRSTISSDQVEQTTAFTPIARPNISIEIPKSISVSPLKLEDSTFIQKREYPGFVLRLENNSLLPLYIKDDRSNIFRDFLNPPNEPLDAYGYYQHVDMTNFCQNRMNETRGFARVHLESNTAIHLKDFWSSLCNDLASRSLCLICFIPDNEEALFFFSSQSKLFGRSIGAPSWAIGIRDRGLVIARVLLNKQDLCFKKQYREQKTARN